MGEVKTLVKKDYLEGMSYKQICEKHEISMNTLKSWISRNGWAKEKKGAHKQKKVHTKTSEYKKDIEKLDNSDLNDRQKLFCIYYIKSFNATKSYQKAYNCSYNTAMVEGSNSLRNPKIEKEIQRLKQSKLNRAMLDEDDIFQAMIDIAFADITDFVSFGNIEFPLRDPDTLEPRLDSEGNEIKEYYSYVSLKNDAEVDGSVISEVSKGRDGVKVKLQDKMKALQWLSDRMDLLPVNVNKKLEMEREKLELIKSADDENIDALNKLDDILRGLGGVMDED